MKLSTNGIKGKTRKFIWVETNDPAYSNFALEVTGEIKQFVTITPSKVLLKGTVGERISQVVTVCPVARESLTILHTDTLNKGNFKYTMKETEVNGKKAYQFLIENTTSSVGRYLNKLLIFTDSIEINPITIVVSGDIRPVESEQIKSGEAPSTPGPE